jgi:hypothetical protein
VCSERYTYGTQALMAALAPRINDALSVIEAALGYNQGQALPEALQCLQVCATLVVIEDISEGHWDRKHVLFVQTSRVATLLNCTLHKWDVMESAVE